MALCNSLGDVLYFMYQFPKKFVEKGALFLISMNYFLSSDQNFSQHKERTCKNLNLKISIGNVFDIDQTSFIKPNNDFLSTNTHMKWSIEGYVFYLQLW